MNDDSSTNEFLTNDGWEDDCTVGAAGIQQHEPSLQTTDGEASSLPIPRSSNAPIAVPLPTEGYTLFSATELSHLRIMQFCDQSGCSRVFFDGIINLLREETICNQLDFTVNAPKRESLLRNLLTTCPTSLPVPVAVSLENNTRIKDPLNYHRGQRDLVHAMVFQFEEQLKDLLSDNHIFGDLSNLDVNPNNPFGKFERTDGRVSEVNSGSCTSRRIPITSTIRMRNFSYQLSFTSTKRVLMSCNAMVLSRFFSRPRLYR
jgi:hypothetical protein